MTENTRRLKSCIEAWPDCAEGEYSRRCCRFPKSCSCDIVHNQAFLDDPAWRDANLEPLMTVAPKVQEVPPKPDRDAALQELLADLRARLEHAHGGAHDAYYHAADRLAAILEPTP